MTKQIGSVIDLMARQIAKAIQIFDTRAAIQPAVAIGGRVGLLARSISASLIMSCPAFRPSFAATSR